MLRENFQAIIFHTTPHRASPLMSKAWPLIFPPFVHRWIPAKTQGKVEQARCEVGLFSLLKQKKWKQSQLKCKAMDEKLETVYMGSSICRSGCCISMSQSRRRRYLSILLLVKHARNEHHDDENIEIGKRNMIGRTRVLLRGCASHGFPIPRGHSFPLHMQNSWNFQKPLWS